MLKVGDKVKVLPNKKVGIITHIVDGFYILDNEMARPYWELQLELIVEPKLIYPEKFDFGKVLENIHYVNAIDDEIDWVNICKAVNVGAEYQAKYDALVNNIKIFVGNLGAYKYQRMNNEYTEFEKAFKDIVTSIKESLPRKEEE